MIAVRRTTGAFTPKAVAPKPSDRLTELEVAFRAERDARGRLREAMRTQGEILQDLRAGGVASSIIAIRVARILGLPLGVESRRKIAAMIRQRTRRHSFLRRRDGAPEVGPVAFPKTEVETMPRLIKRIVTEEFVQTDEDLNESDPDKVDGDSDESDETDEDEVDEPVGQRRRPPSDRRRR